MLLRVAAVLAESLKLLFKRNRPAVDVHHISATVLLLIANHGFYISGRVQGAAACPLQSERRKHQSSWNASIISSTRSKRR
ncbi:hypothetical protein AGR7A_Cc10111 [Agrobacterium deltaense NCPPB 1641]|uniref:Uncharacterized protein n=1 Tax=Agrobacterium deltaense NCPPB 1641 TaxID=1183425 RepID=A0A1S7TIG0_9HYPH|nr:hypothetical protein AGR7A_Cc10111 [Agrobacterium deltaense NCPPB 1641]